MSDLTHDMCKMQLEGLAVYLGAVLSKDVFEADYWTRLKIYNSKQLASIINHLKENYEYQSFPKIVDFRKAHSAIVNQQNRYGGLDYKIDGYSMNNPEEKKKYQKEYSLDIRALAEKFRVPGAKGEPQDKETHRKTNLYKRMSAEGKVFSYKLMKWVDRSLMGNIDGAFILPEEK